MSVEIQRYDKIEFNEDAELIWSYPVSSEAFYQRVWIKAVSDCQVRFFREYSSFLPEKIETVMQELHALHCWTEENLSDIQDYFYMHSRIEELMQVLPEECRKNGGIFFLV